MGKNRFTRDWDDAQVRRATEHCERQLGEEAAAEDEIAEAWAKEVERRIAQVERREVKMIPGEQVIAELRRKYGKQPTHRNRPRRT